MYSMHSTVVPKSIHFDIAWLKLTKRLNCSAIHTWHDIHGYFDPVPIFFLIFFPALTEMITTGCFVQNVVRCIYRNFLPCLCSRYPFKTYVLQYYLISSYRLKQTPCISLHHRFSSTLNNLLCCYHFLLWLRLPNFAFFATLRTNFRLFL